MTSTLRLQGPDMTDQAEPVSTPWRRFLRFSLRGLIVVVLVIGVWFGWLVRGARIQHEAVEAIRRGGGWCLYDWQWRGHHGEYFGEPWAPRWLTTLIGVDYFGHITEVNLYEVGTDAKVAAVARLEHVERLFLFRTTVSDAGLVHLKGLSRLSFLHLANTHVTDAGLANLKQLTNLKHLDISGTRVTGAGVKKLQQSLPSLKISR